MDAMINFGKFLRVSINFCKYLLVPINIFLLFSNFYFLTSDVALAGTAQQAAQDLCSGGTCPISSVEGIFNIIKKVVQWTYTIFFVVAVFFILLAAFNFLTAQGDPEKIKNARSQILWASVAIAIALISVGAAQIINSLITP